MKTRAKQGTKVDDPQEMREAFSERLKQALRDNNLPDDSPTQLARLFNSHSDKSITVHAARKWIVGESIPTQPKLVILADILGAGRMWLRFGDEEGSRQPMEASCPGSLEMVGLFKAMNPQARKAILLVAREIGQVRA